MWPCKNPGEDVRLYHAVQAVSDLASQLGINVPTGKDSLSMTQKYPGGNVVIAPGTVIISAVAEVSDIRRTVSPLLQPVDGSVLIYIDWSRDALRLGGSSFAQTLNAVGDDAPSVSDAVYVARVFEALQSLIREGSILAGHDISAGGLITALLEICFPSTDGGLTLNVDAGGDDVVKILFAENPGVIIQVRDEQKVTTALNAAGVTFSLLGRYSDKRELSITHGSDVHRFDIDELRDVWFSTSYALDKKQRPALHAERRFTEYKKQPLKFDFPNSFNRSFERYGIDPRRM
jgi:phosphoribosylformylglycinamidine synthase